MDDILDVETGGMLEAWADLYGVTGDDEAPGADGALHRRRLFEPLLAGEDVLTNMHANTTIPEAQGAARGLRGDRRGALARHRRGLLGWAVTRPRRLLHRRADQRRDLDAAVRSLQPAWATRTRSTAPSTT